MMVCFLKICHKKRNLSGYLYTKQSFRLRRIKGLIEAFLTVIRGKSQGISQLYVGHKSGINKAYLKCFPGISQISIGHIFDIFQAHHGHNSDI